MPLPEVKATPVDILWKRGLFSPYVDNSQKIDDI
jgi:hypothetical protein